MSVGRICNREVDLADLHESAQVAAARMNARNVGTLIVVDSQSRPIGIVTDRDLAVNVVGKGLDPNTTTVRDVMTKSPDSVNEETAIETAISRMRAGPYRRLPVINRDGKLVGLISLDDILDLLSEEFNEIGRLVRQEGPMALEAAD
jgi:CBS domain-containing protein